MDKPARLAADQNYEQLELFEMYKRLSNKLSELKKERKSIKQDVLEALNHVSEAEAEELGVKKVSYVRKIFKLKEFKEDHPDLYEQYCYEKLIEFPRARKGE